MFRFWTASALGVQSGEMCVVLGPSGSGKSTLLNTVGGLTGWTAAASGLTAPTSRPCLPPRWPDYRRRKTIGFVFQLYHLIPNDGRRTSGGPGRYLSPEPLDLDMLLDVMDMRGHQHKFPAQLSGGQQQRCAIARAPWSSGRSCCCVMSRPVRSTPKRQRKY